MKTKIKILISRFLIIIFKNYIFRRRPTYNKKYNIVICGIFKNESPYLDEWITYHLMLGFDHIYLYNNNSSDNYLAVIEKYIKKGKVTLIDWPFPQGQISAYKHFYDNFYQQSQWVTFLDIDEFYVPKYDRDIKDWIKRHDRWPVLLIYWKMFGTNGRLYEKENEIVIEQYINSWESLVRCGKCIINTDYEINAFTSSIHHRTSVKAKFLGKRFTMFPVNIFNKIVFSEPETIIPKGLYEKADIQINHYWSRSWESYDRKRKMIGDVFFKNNPKNKIEYFMKNETKNISVDYTIYRFLLPLKLKLKGIILEDIHS